MPSAPPMLILASRSPRRAELLREAGYAFVQADPPFADPPQPASSPRHVEEVVMHLALEKARSVLRAGLPLSPWERVAGSLPGAPGEGTYEQTGDPPSRKAAHPNPSRGLPGGEGVILAADTVVVGPDGAWLGQPADVADARRMLAALINATHRVVTGVALLATAGPRHTAFADTAEVDLGAVPPAALEAYLASGDWRGKAGAYNLSELEAIWPLRVRGDPTTVVGLPMRKLRAALAAWPRD